MQSRGRPACHNEHHSNGHRTAPAGYPCGTHCTLVANHKFVFACQAEDLWAVHELAVNNFEAAVTSGGFDADLRVTQYLCLTPTVEAAAALSSILRESQSFAAKFPLLLLRDATANQAAAASLREAHLLIGTAQRINDLIRRQRIDVEFVKQLIIYDVDQVSSTGGLGRFAVAITKSLPRSSRVVLFYQTPTSLASLDTGPSAAGRAPRHRPSSAGGANLTEAQQEIINLFSRTKKKRKSHNRSHSRRHAGAHPPTPPQPRRHGVSDDNDEGDELDRVIDAAGCNYDEDIFEYGDEILLSAAAAELADTAIALPGTSASATTHPRNDRAPLGLAASRRQQREERKRREKERRRNQRRRAEAAAAHREARRQRAMAAGVQTMDDERLAELLQRMEFLAAAGLEFEIEQEFAMMIGGGRGEILIEDDEDFDEDDEVYIDNEEEFVEMDSYEALSRLEPVVCGASPATIAALPTIVYMSNNTVTKTTAGATEQHTNSLLNTTCSICLADFGEGDKVAVLPCRHGYHKTCIVRWLTTNKKCCICKKEVER